MTNEERKVFELALEALQMLHDENMDYLTRNKLGGENNQCMVFARETITAIKESLAQPDQDEVDIRSRLYQRIHELETQLARGEQEPVAWKLVPTKPTEEMLKAMDECSMEGYDERLYAGHAASVYMAAVDVAPTPPQPEKPDQDEVDIRSRLYQRIHELETQLAQPEQEPVGKFAKFTDGIWREVTDGSAGVPLYTAPPQHKE